MKLSKKKIKSGGASIKNKVRLALLRSAKAKNKQSEQIIRTALHRARFPVAPRMTLQPHTGENPTVVVSYQGAFGPPTLGHFETMRMLALYALQENPDCYIRMLFMPTAASSSKIHLLPTQENRIEILNYFCNKLQDIFQDFPIKFEASRIEYELYERKKSTDTHHTVDYIVDTPPFNNKIDKLILAMGQDNILQLPFWLPGVDEWYSKLKGGIYFVKRESLTDENMDAMGVVNYINDNWDNTGNVFKFVGTAPWTVNEEYASKVFGSNKKLKKGNIIQKDKELNKIKLKITLPKIKMVEASFLNDFLNSFNEKKKSLLIGPYKLKIPPSSSSQMRYFIVGNYKKLNNFNNHSVDNINKISMLMFGKFFKDLNDEDIQIINNCIDIYKNLDENILSELSKANKNKKESLEKEYKDFEEWMSTPTKV